MVKPRGRRRWLAAAGLGVAALGLWRTWPEQGLINPCLGPLPPELARLSLLEETWTGLDPQQVWDSHAHIFTLQTAGDQNGGILRAPLAAAQRYFFRNAACVGDDAGDENASYVTHLRQAIDALPAGVKVLLLALDAWHDESGVVHPELTHVRVADDYCAAVAAALPSRFEWAASVHPYRGDAVVAIERAKAAGARALKWIPAAQGIDPASPRCDPVYRTLARLELPLISHAGDERAAPGDDAMGNPLRLRRALEQGVRVIVAHCATLGASSDSDAGPHAAPLDNFSLFARLMAQRQYEGQLFGDLAAITQSARAGPALATIVRRGREGGDWATRLVNGSDYPLPGIMPLYSLQRLVELRLLAPSAVEPLTAIRRHNPLLFDFALKRTLRVDGQGLAASVFETRRVFLPA